MAALWRNDEVRQKSVFIANFDVSLSDTLLKSCELEVLLELSSCDIVHYVKSYCLEGCGVRMVMAPRWRVHETS